MDYKDYYKTLGVERDGRRQDDQVRVPQARPQASSGRQQGLRGALQGDLRGLHGPLRPGEAASATTRSVPTGSATPRPGPIRVPAPARRSRVGRSLRRRERRLLGLLPHHLRRGRRGAAGAGGFSEDRFGDAGDLGGGGWGGVITDRGRRRRGGRRAHPGGGLQGIRRTITLELDEPCPTCGGAGHVNRQALRDLPRHRLVQGAPAPRREDPRRCGHGLARARGGEGPAGTGGGARGDLYLTVHRDAPPALRAQGRRPLR